jgi:hypothetical protein
MMFADKLREPVKGSLTFKPDFAADSYGETRIKK